MNPFERAEKAKELLENMTFQMVMDDLMDGTIATWRNTAAGSVSLREQLAAECRALEAIRSKLKGWIEEAKFEAAKVERIERRRA